jgi:hypothetical protein
MSYVLRFSPGALRKLAELDPWLQEEALDEIELLANRPAQLIRRGRLPGYVHDFVRTREGIKHYVFIHLDRDDAAQRLGIRTIGHVTALEPPTEPAPTS